MELSEERGLGPLPCPGSNAQLRWLRGGYGARREWWHLLGPILVWVICAGCVCVCVWRDGGGGSWGRSPQYSRAGLTELQAAGWQ